MVRIQQNNVCNGERHKFNDEFEMMSSTTTPPIMANPTTALKKELEEEEGENGGETSTVEAVQVHTTIGRSYSVERYYMLSEIEQHAAGPPLYLEEYYKPYSGVLKTDPEPPRVQVPPYVILYVLWDCTALQTAVLSDQHTTYIAESYATGVIHNAMQQLREVLVAQPAHHAAVTTEVYLVVDMLIAKPPKVVATATAVREDATASYYQSFLKLAEVLVRECSNSRSRSRIVKDAASNKGAMLTLSGVTVGVVDHPRAAPGLEACLETILYGAKERRQCSGSTDKSAIGVVCPCDADLLGYDADSETDAVQNVFQACSSSMITIQNAPIDRRTIFATKAHDHWQRKKTIASEERPHRNARSNNNNNPGDTPTSDNTTVVTMMVWSAALLIGVISYYLS